MGSSAGEMISTADDLNKFFSYLLSGKLLKEQQLKQMLTTVPTEIAELGECGLGIFETKLPNGVSIWGHGGSIPGFLTFAGGTIGGKHTLAVNLNSMGKANSPDPFKNILLAEFSK
ncbi:D-stereospecific peptide hydrolase [Bacillus pseudomycoides DSM 12442]|uniref:serine hydrolase n=7 Tax=Bacillus TaxID=1386 RepID=UPI0001A13402|nr:serine hydrolase [Bacillus pseudomycoides]EEM16549.1 D-stereospecific peptide hydrolase [Bacillus pseudomycoides DSM 12442]